MNRIRRFLAPPVFEDEDKSRVASVLNAILLTALVLSVMFLMATPIVSPNSVFTLVATGALVLPQLGALFLIRRGRVQYAGMLFSSLLWGMITFWSVVAGGVSSSSFGTYVVVILIAGLSLGWRAGIVFIVLSVLAGLGMLYAEINGVLPPPLVSNTPVSVWAAQTASFAAAAALLYLAIRGITDALERARSNERDLAESNRELQDIRASLEERVAGRTRDLEASAEALAARGQELESALAELQQREMALEEAVRLQEENYSQLQDANEDIQRRSVQLQAVAEVGRAMSQVRDPDELLAWVTTLISRRFGFYHVGVFLIDEIGRHAVLRAANSEGGERMLARGHRLLVGGGGIVGYVTGRGQPRVALDVGADAAFFDNPDLPDTRSEVALPLRRGGEIIGALDVQSTEPSAFSDEDVAVLQTLADQVSVAMENAHLFSQTQAALAEAGAAQRQYLRQEWTRYAQESAALDYEYLLSGWEGLAGQPFPARDTALAEGTTVALSGDAGEGGADLAVPIKLQDRVVGVLDLQDMGQDRHWTPEEIALVEAVAEQLGLAIEAARLFEQTQTRARREALTRQITERIRDAMDVDSMLQTAVQELGRALGAPRVFVRLTTDTGDHDTTNDTIPSATASG